jgi:sialic acid synthase SpsE
MSYLQKFNFKDLYILDLANNHQGSVEHGQRIIRECAEVVKKHGVSAAVKFQFRDLPQFVHKDERANSTNKHVPRFLSTRLPWDSFKELLATIREQGLLSMCTPFDEASVAKIVEMRFNIIKIASCSARDWPLLEEIAASGLPVVASTGGLRQEEVDDLVSFLVHRGCEFALMHCVSIYPTPDEACNLANIAEFKERYPGRTIGWSTHEPPQETVHVGLATALGAEMFERHVGVETDKIKLNAYSSTPQQVDTWIAAAQRAKRLIGSRKRRPPLEAESASIDDLKRGVFARTEIEAGQPITDDKIYFAFPYRPGQISSAEWKQGIVASKAVSPDAPVLKEAIELPEDPDVQIIKRAIHEAKACWPARACRSRTSSPPNIPTTTGLPTSARWAWC